LPCVTSFEAAGTAGVTIEVASSSFGPNRIGQATLLLSYGSARAQAATTCMPRAALLVDGA
jgi:hypothetical protein